MLVPPLQNDVRFRNGFWIFAGLGIILILLGSSPERVLGDPPSTEIATESAEIATESASSDPDTLDSAIDEISSQIGLPTLEQANVSPASTDLVAASEWAQRIAPTDWLGPLAPIALSPFFGMTLLSAIAIWGPESLANNSFVSAATPLHDPRFFQIFLVLTIITSLPRLATVSKGFAQAVDKLETYAVIITLLVIRWLASQPAGVTEDPAVLQAGIGTFSVDMLLYFAMIINILVINSVKFFFEILVWLIPIPLFDAAFEICNKSICAGLMTLYVFSPTLATLLNLVLFAAAAVVFRWTNRRVQFYRAMLLDPLIALLLPNGMNSKKPQLTVFANGSFADFPAKAKLSLIRRDDGWDLIQHRGWLAERRLSFQKDQFRLQMQQGLLINRLIFVDDQQGEIALSFSRRHFKYFEEKAQAIHAEIQEDLGLRPGSIQTELA